MMIMMAGVAMSQTNIVYDTFPNLSISLRSTGDSHYMMPLTFGNELAFVMVSFHTDTLYENQLYSMDATDSIYTICRANTRVARWADPNHDTREDLDVLGCSLMIGRGSDNLQYLNMTITTDSTTYQLYSKELPQEETPDTLVLSSPEAFYRVTEGTTSNHYEITYTVASHYYVLDFNSTEFEGIYRTEDFGSETALYEEGSTTTVLPMDSIYAEITRTDTNTPEYHINTLFYGEDGQTYNIVTNLRQHVATDTVLLRADNVPVSVYTATRPFSFNFNNGDYVFNIFMEKQYYDSPRGHYTEFDFKTIIPVLKDRHTSTPYETAVASMDMVLDTDDVTGEYLIDLKLVCVNDTCYHFQLTNRHDFNTDNEAQTDYIGHYTTNSGYSCMTERHGSMLHYIVELEEAATTAHLLFPYTHDDDFALVENGTYTISDFYYPFAPIADSSVVMASFGHRDDVVVPSYIQHGDSIWYLAEGEVIMDNISTFTSGATIIGTSTSGHHVEFSFTKAEAGIVETAETRCTLYPNPVSSILHIEGDNVQHVTVYDMTGRIVCESSTNEVGMSTLPEGLYLVKVQTSEGMITEKIIKK